MCVLQVNNIQSLFVCLLLQLKFKTRQVFALNLNSYANTISLYYASQYR